MSQKTKSDILRMIKTNIENINNPENQKKLEENPSLVWELIYTNTNKISDLLVILENQLDELKPYIKKLELTIDNITDKKVSNATFLLLSSVVWTFASIFILAGKWHYNSIMILLRNIEEALMQCNLLGNEFNDNKNWKLEKWFLWEIISHWEGRKNLSEKLDNIDINTKWLQSYIYQITSQFAHNWYIAMIENINPYTKMIDFNWLTWLHRTISALSSASRSMDNLTIALKGINVFILKDFKSYDEIDKILLKYNPKLAKIAIPKNMQDMFPKN